MDKNFEKNAERNQPTTRLNNEIKASRVLVINEAGEKHESSFYEALNQANGQGLDLVQVGSNKGMPVCRVFDYSKHMYQEKKKRDKQNTKNRVQEVKTMNFRPGIGDNDLKIKAKKINEFLMEGHRVKISVRLKNREFTMKDMNEAFVSKLMNTFNDNGVRDGNVFYTNKEISFLVKPVKKETVKETASK